MSKLYKFHAPLGSEFSCPDMEMIPPKTAGNSPPEHSLFMYLALKRAGIPAELHIYAKTAHDFGVQKNDQPYSTWTESCAHWLRHQGFLNSPPQP